MFNQWRRLGSQCEIHDNDINNFNMCIGSELSNLKRQPMENQIKP